MRYANAVYVLHAFQKKSKKGIATPKAEMDLIEKRLKDLVKRKGEAAMTKTPAAKDPTRNGWLQLGIGQPPTAAWNPIGGFTDDFGRLMWFALGDAAAIPSPYEAAWVLNRISEVEAIPRR